jgi:L-lactate dehydrogenase complex protein LldG
MSVRDDILGRLRRQLGRTDSTTLAARERVEATLALRQTGPRAAADALLDRFIERARAMISSVDRCATEAEVPAHCADWLRGQGLPTTLVVAPALAVLDWAGAGLSVEARGARDADLVGITGCFCAVAETGTLMMCSGADTPPAASLLPETHIAVVPRQHIVADMEAAWAEARRELSAWPRAVNFVSGPSRTADIEQTIVLGAHGPYRVHLLIVG